MSIASQAEARILRLCPHPLRWGWRYSDLVLVQEYTRGVARLARHLGDAFPGGRFPALAALAGKLPEYPPIPYKEVAHPDVHGTYARGILEYYHAWAHLQDAGNPIALKHPALYEPLMRLVERGAYYIPHHGEILLDGWALPAHGWPGYPDPKMDDLSDAALDHLDRDYAARQ